MSTPYSEIFDRFLNALTDYELADKAIQDTVGFENDLVSYLKKAITHFVYSKKNLSDRDDENQIFNVDLTELEQEILALYMVPIWLSPNILRLENIRQNIGNSDFRIFSPGNHLDKLTTLKQELKSEAENLALYYYYSSGDE